MNKFIYNLERLNRFVIRLGRLQYIEGEYRQKMIDVLLSVDLVRLSWRRDIQKAILITGDSDFVPAINEAKDAGVIVGVFYGNHEAIRIHDELYKLADERYEIDSELLNSASR